MKRIFLALLVAGLWHSSVSADDYFWRGSSSVFFNVPAADRPHMPSKESAIKYAEDIVINNIAPTRYIRRKSVATNTDKKYVVIYGVYYEGDVFSQDIAINADRFGDGCTLPSEYNPTTGECVAPAGNPGEACEEDREALTGFGRIQNSEGQCVDFTRADTPSQCTSLGGRSSFTNIYVSFDDDGNPQNPPPTTVNGCETIVATVAHCTKAPKRVYPTGGSIQPATNKCRVGVSFTGNTAEPGPLSVSSGPDSDGACDPATGCPPPDPGPIENESKPCTYVYDGEGRRTCSSSNFNYKPGESSCGSVNGEFKCVGKAPEVNGVDIKTTITETNNADGTKTVTKEDTATVTKCIGGNSCKTEVTNNKVVTVKDGNGNTVSESGTCTGPACSDSGKGNKGNCAPGEECSDEEEFGGPDNEEAAGFGESTQAFIDRASAAPLMAAARGLTFAGGGSCSFGSFSVPVLGTLSFQPMCNWAADWFAPLKTLMLCLWALVAVRTFFEA